MSRVAQIKLVGLFYLAVQSANLYKTATELSEEKASEIASILAGTAEFSCGKGKENCVDFDKIMVLKNRQVYDGFWPSDISSIKVYKIYPKYRQVECSTSNFDNCSFIVVYDKNVKNERAYSRFVSICREENIQDYHIEKCELGKIVVGAELKTK